MFCLYVNLVTWIRQHWSQNHSSQNETWKWSWRQGATCLRLVTWFVREQICGGTTLGCFNIKMVCGISNSDKYWRFTRYSLRYRRYNLIYYMKWWYRGGLVLHTDVFTSKIEGLIRILEMPAIFLLFASLWIPQIVANKPVCQASRLYPCRRDDKTLNFMITPVSLFWLFVFWKFS